MNHATSSQTENVTVTHREDELRRNEAAASVCEKIKCETSRFCADVIKHRHIPVVSRTKKHGEEKSTKDDFPDFNTHTLTVTHSHTRKQEMSPSRGLLLIYKSGCLGNKFRRQRVLTELNVNHKHLTDF